jgi:hypothetical protein
MSDPWFRITQEHIDVINTATESLNKLNKLENGVMTILCRKIKQKVMMAMF